jgi:hypothetical protein
MLLVVGVPTIADVGNMFGAGGFTHNRNESDGGDKLMWSVFYRNIG